jgi:hypothetical protein
MTNLDDDRGYETVSVIDGFAADPSAFFGPAQAVSGINESTVQEMYEKLTHGYFTWTAPGQGQATGGNPVTNVRYPEVNPTRLNWMTMRAGWAGPQNTSAYEYEGDFIRFQVFTENCFYVVAEHMVRYRAIFKKACEDITALMNALTDKFANPAVYGNGITFEWPSIIITGLVVVVTTVITEGAGTTVGITLAAAVVEMLGEAGKTAKSNGTETHHVLDGHTHLRDTVKQYLDAVNKIEHDTAEAIKQLYESLRVEVDKLRDARQYEAVPNTGTKTMWVPQFRDYV